MGIDNIDNVKKSGDKIIESKEHSLEEMAQIKAGFQKDIAELEEKFAKVTAEYQKQIDFYKDSIAKIDKLIK